ncbi:uncharacterized protein VTP21DRAFT_3921 [Calcarisporiella thermophila]|uniref:uncharacterized protein n=1 Tax=Calcarisporiella thermophila TaxID=911321 RepID=UPI003743978A
MYIPWLSATSVDSLNTQPESRPVRRFKRHNGCSKKASDKKEKKESCKKHSNKAFVVEKEEKPKADLKSTKKNKKGDNDVFFVQAQTQADTEPTFVVETAALASVFSSTSSPTPTLSTGDSEVSPSTNNYTPLLSPSSESTASQIIQQNHFINAPSAEVFIPSVSIDPSDSSSQSADPSSDTGKIVGGVVGSVAGVAAIVGFFLIRKARTRASSTGRQRVRKADIGKPSLLHNVNDFVHAYAPEFAAPKEYYAPPPPPAASVPMYQQEMRMQVEIPAAIVSPTPSIQEDNPPELELDLVPQTPFEFTAENWRPFSADSTYSLTSSLQGGERSRPNTNRFTAPMVQVTTPEGRVTKEIDEMEYTQQMYQY